MQDSYLHLPVISIAYASSDSARFFHEQVTDGLVACGLLVATVQVVLDAGDCGHVRARTGLLSFDLCHAGKYQYTYQGTVEDLLFRLSSLARSVDLILVESDSDLGFPQLVIDQGETRDVSASFDLHACLHNPADAVLRIMHHLQQKLARRPVWACILIGGRSSRMGRPKHLLPDGTGATWLERIVRTVRPYVSGIVLSGRGEIPAGLQPLIRLPDIPNVSGPLTGILSAMRWQPDVSWLLLACDMPKLTSEAVVWLLDQKKPGQWGAVPAIAGRKGVEPLFARYEPQCAAVFEQMSAQGILRISSIADFDRVRIVQVPGHLHSAWQNINTPGELDASVM